jgi:hypothetical protein
MQEKASSKFSSRYSSGNPRCTACICTNGKPMNPCTFTYRFKLILKANNLPLNLNVHSLRHTNASLLIAQDVDVRTVASLLGHVQASTTLLHCMADGAGNSRDIAKLLKGHGSFLSACFFILPQSRQKRNVFSSLKYQTNIAGISKIHFTRPAISLIIAPQS